MTNAERLNVRQDLLSELSRKISEMYDDERFDYSHDALGHLQFWAIDQTVPRVADRVTLKDGKWVDS